jgi:hypothetical protein
VQSSRARAAKFVAGNSAKASQGREDGVGFLLPVTQRTAIMPGQTRLQFAFADDVFLFILRTSIGVVNGQQIIADLSARLGQNLQFLGLSIIDQFLFAFRRSST